MSKKNHLPKEEKNTNSPAWELFMQEHGEKIGNLENALKPEIDQSLADLSLTKEEKEEHKQLTSTLKELRIKEAVSKIPDPENLNSGTEIIEAEVKNKKKLTPFAKTIITVAACGVVLAGTVFGSAYYLKKTFQAEKEAINNMIALQLEALVEDNKLAMEDVSLRMAEIDSQMAEIVVILESTDEAILSSGAANREAMAKRIEELDSQLASLKKSLNILMESKGGS